MLNKEKGLIFWRGRVSTTSGRSTAWQFGSSTRRRVFEQMAHCEMCEAGVWACWEISVDDRRPCVSCVLRYAQERVHVVYGSSTVDRWCQRSGIKGMHIHAAFCGSRSLPNVVTGLITMKYGHAGHTCLVFSADALPLGTCQTFWEATIMVKRLVSGQTLDRLAEVGVRVGRRRN